MKDSEEMGGRRAEQVAVETRGGEAGVRCQQAIARSWPSHSRQEGPQTVENEGKRRRPERLPREHDVRPGWPREGRQDGKGGREEGRLPGGRSVASDAQGEAGTCCPVQGSNHRCGESTRERADPGTRVTGFLRCTPETSTRLLINYIPIQNTRFKY